MILEPLAEERRASAWPRSPTITRPARRRWPTRTPGRPTSRCRRNALYLGAGEWAAAARRPRAGAPDAVRRCRRAGPSSKSARRQGRNFAAERAETARQRLRCRRRARAGAAGRRQARRGRALERGRARAHGPCAVRSRPAQSRTVAILARRAGAAQADGRRWRCWASRPGSRPPNSPSSASRTSWAIAWCGRAAQAQARRRTSSPKCQPLGRRSRGARRPRHRPLRRPEEHRGRRRAARLPGDPLRRRRPSCSCRSRTSSCCRATAPRTLGSSSTGSAAPAGRRARRG